MKRYDYGMLLNDLEMLMSNGAVRAEVLTTSILGRKIPLIRMGEGKKKVLYVGAHHGAESVSAAVLMDFAAEYLRLQKSGGAVFEQKVPVLFAHREILLVPMLNPDGVEYSVNGPGADNPLLSRVTGMNGGSGDFTRWQANARGVDLNHNYDAGFGKYKAMEEKEGIPCGAPTRYSGEYPESEPESAALCRLIRAERSDLLGVLTLHTQGEEIYSSCGQHLSAKCLSAGRILQRMTGYELKNPVGLAAFGGLTDWCIEALDLPSFTVECGRGENPLPAETRPLIYEKLRRALFAFPFFFA